MKQGAAFKRRKHFRLVLGITGGFGSGKTTVAKCFRSFGAYLIDADKIARDLLVPGTGAYRKILAVFGASIIRKDKSIDRRKLARIIFGNDKLLKKLNRIIHPKVIFRIHQDIKAHQGIIAIDAPLLFETGLFRKADFIIVVNAGRRKQIARLAKKRHFSREDILARIRAQMPLYKKAKQADIIIDNSGTVAQTKRQVKQLIRRYQWKDRISGI